MRLQLSVLPLAIACSDLNNAEKHSVLETRATSYVAADSPESRFDYAITLILEHRNTSDLIVRTPSCRASVAFAHARYVVEKVGSGDAAWSPDFYCETLGVPFKVLRPGESRTDTLFLRAPWQRSFNGQPIGDFEGSFYVVYTTQACVLVTTWGACVPENQIEFVRSNEFTITTP